VADDSSYWNKWEDDLTDAEREARAEDLSWARYRAFKDREQQGVPDEAKLHEQANRPLPPIGPYEKPTPEPKKKRSYYKVWLVVVLMGIPSVVILVMGLLAGGDSQHTIPARELASWRVS
jgi:hypothetical protein